MSYLHRPTTVSWESLRFQFGTQAESRTARHEFKQAFIGHLARAVAVHPDARVDETASGLRLLPSRVTHIARNKRPALG
jgi:hypothetical protein